MVSTIIIAVGLVILCRSFKYSGFGAADRGSTARYHGSNNVASVVLIYGTILCDLSSALNLGNDSDHKKQVSKNLQFSQFFQVSKTTDVVPENLGNDSIEIQGCNFIVNVARAALMKFEKVGCRCPISGGSRDAFEGLSNEKVAGIW